MTQTKLISSVKRNLREVRTTLQGIIDHEAYLSISDREDHKPFVVCWKDVFLTVGVGTDLKPFVNPTYTDVQCFSEAQALWMSTHVKNGHGSYPIIMRKKQFYYDLESHLEGLLDELRFGMLKNNTTGELK